MDTSPRPPRRFSRWKTTKRPFQFGGVFFKPPTSVPNLQDEQRSPQTAKEKINKINETSNGKIDNMSLDQSMLDFVDKRESKNLSSVKRSSVVRKLTLDMSTSDQNKNVTAITDKVKQSVQVESVDKQQKNMAIDGDQSDSGLIVDAHLTQEISAQNNRMDCGATNNETTLQTKKYVLSNISQNASTNKPAAIDILLSQNVNDNSLNNATWTTKQTIVHKASKRKRSVALDEELSSSSSTDKENKDKDPTNSDIHPVIKKVKQDGSVNSLSSSSANKTIQSVNDSQTLNNQSVEKEVSSSRMSSLRNRSLLVSAETMKQKRQYPEFKSSRKKKGDLSYVPPVKENSSSAESSFNKSEKTTKSSYTSKIKNVSASNLESKKQNTPLYSNNIKNSLNVSTKNSDLSERKRVSNLKLVKQNAIQTNESLNVPEVEEDSSSSEKVKYKANVSGLKLKKANRALLQNKTLNKSEMAAEHTYTMNIERNNHSLNDSSSRSVSGSLRDRRKLPTPEEVQQKRQYPISFLSSKKLSASVNSNSGYKTNAKKQKKFETVSLVKQNETLKVAKTATNKDKMLDGYHNTIFNKNKTLISQSFNTNSEISSKKQSQPNQIERDLHDSTLACETAAEVVSDCDTILTFEPGNLEKYHRKHGHQSSHKSKKQTTPIDERLSDTDFDTLPAQRSFIRKRGVDSDDNTSEKKAQTFSNKSSKDSSSLAVTRKPLLQQPLNKSANYKVTDSRSTQMNISSFETDPSAQLPQSQATNEDSSHEQPQKIAHKRPLLQEQQKPKVQTVEKSLSTKKMPKVSVSDVFVINKETLKGMSKASVLEEEQEFGLDDTTNKKTDAASINSQKNKLLFSSVKETQKSQVESSHNANKLLHLKSSKHKYSLPKRPSKMYINEGHGLSLNFGLDESFGQEDAFVLQLQMPEAETSSNHPQKISKNKRSPLPKKQKIKVQNVGQTLTTNTMTETSFNETVNHVPKQKKRRNLLQEIARSEEVAEETSDNEVLLWREAGLAGRLSNVTAYDVILQAMIDEEEKLLDEMTDDKESRIVTKVMGQLRRSIKTMVLKVKETQNMRHDIKKQDNKIKKLMAEIKKKQDIAREKLSRHEDDQEAPMVRYHKVLEAYSQLIQRYDSRS